MSGILVIISGPSGSGKNSILSRLIDLGVVNRITTTTTREPREGEVDGVDYNFTNRGKFLVDAANEEMLEYNEYSGNLYGSPKKTIFNGLNNGDDLGIILDVNGAYSVRDYNINSLTIFISPPDKQTIINRLSVDGNRNDLDERLEEANREMERINEYDICFINEDIEKTTGQICAFVKLIKESKSVEDSLDQWRELTKLGTPTVR